MEDWADWQKNYVHGTFVIWPPDPVRRVVNRLRQEYDPVSQAICETHVTLTQPFLRQPDDAEWATLYRIVAGFDPFEITYGPLNNFFPYPCIWFEIHPSQKLLEIRHALHQTGLFNLDLPHTDDFIPHMTITESLSDIEATQGMFERLSSKVSGGSFTCSSVAYITPNPDFHFHVEQELWLKKDREIA
jgi:2'-5' RNA ligase